MNKRGQIYIIAALILSVVIFLLVSQTNFVQRILIEDDFEQLSKNFDIESAKFMNSLLAAGEIEVSKVIDAFEKFADEFSMYSWVENPGFEFIYILNYKGKKIFGNYMLEDLEVGGVKIAGVGDVGDTVICVDGSCLTAGIKRDITRTNVNETSLQETDIKIRGIRYNLGLMEGPQIVIISREEKGEQTKVYMNKEFIEGEKVD